MAYIGRDIQYGVLDKQSFTTNGSTTVFVLDSGVQNAKSLLVSVGGVIQEPGVAYTASGTTLTFTAAPANGVVAYAIFLGKTLENAGARDQITFQSETGDATTTPFTLSATPTNAQSIMVTLNGVTQVPNTDYTVNGTTITFTVAPANAMGILVYHLGSAAAIGTINDNSVTDAKIVGMSASKLSGSLGANTVASTSIVSLDASKLTGTLPNSLAVDTTALDQTIAALGLHVAVADNKVSFNLPDAFLDQFEGDDGILTETTVDRDTTGEYVNSISGSAYGTQHTVTALNDTQHTTSYAKFGTSSITFDGTNDELNVAHHSDFVFGGSNFTIDMWIRTSGSGNSHGYGFFQKGNGSSTGTYWWLGSAGSQLAIKFYTSGGTVYIAGGPNLADTLWHHVALVNNGNVWTSYVDGVQAATQTLTGTDSTTDEFGIGRWNANGGTGWFNGNMDDIRVSNTALWTTGFSVPTVRAVPDATTLLLIGSDNQSNASTTFTDNNSVQAINATGTLISTASTASSANTSASGVMLYSDASGTATLGTDLEVYFSADDGANWTEASSYGTPITFSGTTKMVKLGKTTGLTSGTQMKLKAVWANQVASVAGTSAGYETGDRTSTITVTDDTPGQAGGLINDGDGVPAKLVDGVTNANSGSACTFHGTPAPGRYLRFQFSTAKTVTEAKWYQDSAWTHGVWKWQGSNDGTSFTDIGNSFTLGGTLQTQTELSGNTTAYTYYQLLGISGSASGSSWIREVEFKYAAVAGVTGKETRLHGWALNY